MRKARGEFIQAFTLESMWFLGDYYFILILSYPVWPDLAKFRHFGNILKVLGNYVRAYLVLGKNLNLRWSTFYAIGQVFIAANDLILTNNLAIWSHWSYLSPNKYWLLLRFN